MRHYSDTPRDVPPLELFDGLARAFSSCVRGVYFWQFVQFTRMQCVSLQVYVRTEQVGGRNGRSGGTSRRSASKHGGSHVAVTLLRYLFVRVCA